jgi:hypothetical protein
MIPNFKMLEHANKIKNITIVLLFLSLASYSYLLVITYFQTNVKVIESQKIVTPDVQINNQDTVYIYNFK